MVRKKLFTFLSTMKFTQEMTVIRFIAQPPLNLSKKIWVKISFSYYNYQLFV